MVRTGLQTPLERVSTAKRGSEGWIQNLTLSIFLIALTRTLSLTRKVVWCASAVILCPHALLATLCDPQPCHLFLLDALFVVRTQCMFWWGSAGEALPCVKARHMQHTLAWA